MIEKNSQVPRKILERHRKYIVAAIEILSGEYPYLAEYLRYIREEKEK
jgi:RNA polymerase sigma factor